MSGLMSRRLWGKGFHDPVLLEITDGHESIDLLEGRDGFYLEEWVPGGLGFKGGGKFTNSPMADGRQLVHYVYDNGQEVFKGMIAGSNVGAAIRTSRRIRQMLIRGANYFKSGQGKFPVWLVAQARGEAYPRYAPLVFGMLPTDESPLSSAWNQTDGRSVWQSVPLAVEHMGWRDYPPGEVGDTLGSATIHYDNLITNPTLDWGTTAPTGWTAYGTGSEAASYDPVKSGRNSVLIVSTSSTYRYLYQTVSGLTTGVTYHVEVTLYAGPRPELMRVGTGAISASTPTFYVLPTIPNAWQTIELDVVAAAGGFRMFIGVAGSDIESEYGVFDFVLVTRYHGRTRSVDDLAPGALVANQDIPYNLTHVFRYDSSGASYSANLLDASFPIDLWPSDPITTDDALYFGSANGVFHNIALVISQVSQATLAAESFVWEYWNGASWTSTSFDVFDGTAQPPAGDATPTYYQPFAYADPTGRVIVFNFTAVNPAWAQTTINSQLAYWVRLRCTAASVTLNQMPQVSIAPFMLNKPYVELRADQIGGDLPALLRLEAINQGSKLQQNTIFETANAADDCVATSTPSFSYIGTGISMGDISGTTYDAGLRFPTVAIPKEAEIVTATLYFDPSASDATGSCHITFSAEDEDDPIDFMTDDATSFQARTRGSTVINQTMAAWVMGNPATQAITSIIQAQVDRAGWEAGNAIVIFMDDNGSTTDHKRSWYSTGNGAFFDPYLSVTYKSDGMFSTIVVAAARSVDRGAQFTPYLYANSKNENGIEYRVREGSFLVGVGPTTPACKRPGGEYTEFEAGDMGTTAQGSDVWADRGTWKLRGGTAQQYSGTYHAWVVVSKQSTASTLEFNIRLRISSGSGGESYSSEAVTSQENAFFGISVGQITIPEIAAWDEVEIGIQVNTSSTYSLYIQGIALMPADEWIAEVRDVAGRLGGAPKFGESVVMDSATVPKRNLWAPVIDRLNRQVNTMRVISPGRAQIEAQRAVRLFFFVQTDPVHLIYDWHYLPSDELLLEQFHQIGHLVNVKPLQRYFSMRGDS